jgi:hypothetical protein
VAGAAWHVARGTCHVPRATCLCGVSCHRRVGFSCPLVVVFLVARLRARLVFSLPLRIGGGPSSPLCTVCPVFVGLGFVALVCRVARGTWHVAGDTCHMQRLCFSSQENQTLTRRLSQTSAQIFAEDPGKATSSRTLLSQTEDVARGTLHVARSMWHVACGMWHVARGT